MQYLVVVEKAEHNYAAYVPDLPGCVSTGKTIEQTLDNIREAIAFHLEGMSRDGDPLPPRYTVLATSVEVPDYVSVSRAAAD
ncbi:MAG: type II toxin-antitoxin system HicB family antitoxin [Chloroflexota bacterium]|nr:type II toxin-antitoxin system HicB family antitoxin [Chloroflexota bacterium]